MAHDLSGCLNNSAIRQYALLVKMTIHSVLPKAFEGGHYLKLPDSYPATRRPLYMHPLLFAAAWSLLGLLFSVQDWAEIHRLDVHLYFGRILWAWEVMYLIWAAFLWILVRFWGKWLLQVRIPQTLIYLLPLSIALTILEEMLWLLCFPQYPMSRSHLTYWVRLAQVLRHEMIDGILIFWAAFFFYRGATYYTRLREKETAAAQLETQLVHAQMSALRANLNPHFLFNTLNGISSLMRTDVGSADEMLEQLASLLRITLQREDVQQIRLSDEIGFIEMYMAMQQRRFAGRVREHVRIAPELHDALIPAMLLQPIVENAYTHGISRVDRDGLVEIEAHRTADHVCIKITNSGTGIQDVSNGGGRGLTNVKSRLRLHYGDRQSFILQESAPGVVTVVLTFPFQPGPAEAEMGVNYGA
jgi:sensor histidine kinase YesM